jgi:hypothetical protein
MELFPPNGITNKRMCSVTAFKDLKEVQSHSISMFVPRTNPRETFFSRSHDGPNGFPEGLNVYGERDVAQCRIRILRLHRPICDTAGMCRFNMCPNFYSECTRVYYVS